MTYDHFAPKRYMVTIRLTKKEQTFLDIEAESESHAYKLARQAIFNWQNEPKLKDFGDWLMEIHNVEIVKFKGGDHA